MSMLLALFNDAPIMAIAYDRVHYADEPEKWNMRVVLSMATFLGLIGVIETFVLLYIVDVILRLGHPVIQSLIFLKLAVAGQLTIFMARTRGPFWSIMPSAHAQRRPVLVRPCHQVAGHPGVGLWLVRRSHRMAACINRLGVLFDHLHNHRFSQSSLLSVA